MRVMASHAIGTLMGDGEIRHQLLVGESTNGSVNVITGLTNRQFRIHQFHTERRAVATIASCHIQARVGTNEVRVNQFFHWFGVGRALVLLVGRSVTLTAHDGTGNVGEGQNVVLTGGFCVLASGTVTLLATDINSSVFRLSPRDIDGLPLGLPTTNEFVVNSTKRASFSQRR